MGIQKEGTSNTTERKCWTLEEVAEAVDNGETISWMNDLYTVIKCATGYGILCNHNGNLTGLTEYDFANGCGIKFFQGHNPKYND